MASRISELARGPRPQLRARRMSEHG
jgi:hypothetical protein